MSDPRDFTGYLLRNAFLRAASIAAARFADGPAHPRDAGVLATLESAGSLSQQDLAERLSVNRTVMVKLIDSLEARGLVERHRNPEDRRAYALQATNKGREALGEMLPRMADAEAELAAALAPEERTRLNTLLRGLIDTPPPAMADRTGFLLARAHHRFHERADAVLEPLGIQVRQFGALRVLAGGVPSQRELADRLKVSTPVVVELVDALEGRGLVQRRRDSTDRRANVLVVTPAGHTAAERGAAKLKAMTEELTRAIGKDGDRELRSLLRKL